MASFTDGLLLWLGAYALHSTIFLGAVWLFEQLWRRAPPALLSALWRTALLAGIATASLQASGLVNPIAGRFAIAMGAPSEAAASQDVLTPPAGIVQAGAPPSRAVADQAHATAGASAAETATPLDVVADSGWTFDLDIGAILLTLWAGIVVLLSVRAAFMWWAAHRELRDRQPVVRGPLFERIQALAHDVGLRRLPQVSFSTRIAGPFTLPNGEICIPVWARERLPQSQLDAMLAHEMAHVLHRDSLWLTIGMALGTVFFFQPLNLVARRRLANLAEFSADDWAATRAGNGRALAECISTFVDIAHERAKAIATPEFAAAMAKPRSELIQRVERLLNNRYTSGVLPMKTRLTIGVCAFAFGAAMPGLAAQAQFAPPEEVAPEPPAPAALAQAPQTPAPPETTAEPELAGAPEVPSPALEPAPAPEPQHSVSISQSDGRVRFNIESRDNGQTLKATADGVIRLAPDGSGVTSIANGGHLDATLTRGGQTRRVRYTGASGAVQRQFWVGGQSRAWGPEADAFEAELMPILFRETGIGADERVDWLLKQRGPDGLFAEIGLIDSDPVQTGYITRWFETAKLAPPMLERVMDLASRDIDSDPHLQATLDEAYKTQKPTGRTLVALLKAGESIDSDPHATALLNEVGATALATDETASAYYELTRSVDSDPHMLAVLEPLVKNAATSDARIAETLRLGASDIDSDPHLEALLEAAAPRVRTSVALTGAYLEAARSIDSDPHLLAALESLVQNAATSDAQVADTLRLGAKEIDSDPHLAALLEEAAPRVRNSDALARAYVEAANAIGSDPHKAAALTSLAEKAQLSPQGWRDLLGSASLIGSDPHKASLLTDVADRMPRQPALIEAWREAVRSIGSDSHRRSVERALP